MREPGLDSPRVEAGQIQLWRSWEPQPTEKLIHQRPYQLLQTAYSVARRPTALLLVPYSDVPRPQRALTRGRAADPDLEPVRLLHDERLQLFAPLPGV